MFIFLLRNLDEGKPNNKPVTFTFPASYSVTCPLFQERMVTTSDFSYLARTQWQRLPQVISPPPAQSRWDQLKPHRCVQLSKNMRHWGNLSLIIFGLKYSQYMLVFFFSLIFTWKEHRNKTWKASLTRRTSHLLRPLWNLDLDETQLINWTHSPT